MYKQTLSSPWGSSGDIYELFYQVVALRCENNPLHRPNPFWKIQLEIHFFYVSRYWPKRSIFFFFYSNYIAPHWKTALGNVFGPREVPQPKKKYESESAGFFPEVRNYSQKQFSQKVLYNYCSNLFLWSVLVSI